MKTSSVSLTGVSMLLFALVHSTPTFAQAITFFPPVDNLNFVGSCTPPQMISHLHNNASGLDSIIIRPAFSEPLCTDFPPTPTNTIPECYFIVQDSLNQLRYELWLRHSESWYGSPVRLGFDTIYWLDPESFSLVLFAFQGTTIIDSASARFQSVQTGLAVDQNNSMPSSIALEQNYPNPFNPTTTIRFQIPHSSFVSLRVYDMLGNEVATLVNEVKQLGTFAIDFDASNLTSGAYLYRLQSGSVFQSRKLIIIK